MPNSSSDLFGLHPVLPVAFGYDYRTVFPIPSAPSTPSRPPSSSDRRHRTQTPATDRASSPAMTETESTPAPPRSNASVASHASSSDVSALLTSSGPGPSSRRRSKEEKKRYGAGTVKVSSGLKEAVTFRYVVLPHSANVHEPDPADDLTKFSVGDLYVLKDVSNPTNPTYKVWVCAIPDDPKGKSKAPISRVWREVPAGENIPHPNTSIPLFFIFHETTGKPSWVLHRTLQKYRQTAARKELVDEFMAEFESPPKKRKI